MTKNTLKWFREFRDEYLHIGDSVLEVGANDLGGGSLASEIGGLEYYSADIQARDGLSY